jgi:hypothetical protein
MKHKLYIRLVYGIISLSLLGACKTQPEIITETEAETETLVPITLSIIERAELTKDNIGGIQFYVFGRVALEREETQLNRSRIEERGNLIFEDVHIREQILIKSQTPGVGVDLRSDDTGKLLIVSFDEQGTEYHLYFTKLYNDPDPYFYLSFDRSGKIEDGDEKGSLVYRDKVYKVKYSGEKPPFLLLNLEQKDIEQPHTRILRGRTVPGNSNGQAERGSSNQLKSVGSPPNVPLPSGN